MLIQEPHDHDIVSGRGQFSRNHPGNRYLLEKVRENKDLYDRTKKDQKKVIAQDIANHISKRNPPGRFLFKQDMKGDTSMWKVLPYDHKKVIFKVTQIFRDLRTKQERNNQAPNRVSLNSETNFQNSVQHSKPEDHPGVATVQQEQKEEGDYQTEESQLQHLWTKIDTHESKQHIAVIRRSLGSFSVMDTNVSLSSLPDKDKIFGSPHVGNGGDKNATTEENNVANSDDKMPSPKMMTKKDRQRFFLQRDESYNGSGRGSGSGALSRKDRQRSFLTRDSSTLGDRGSAFSMQLSSYSTSLPSAEVEDVNDQPIVHAYQQSRNQNLDDVAVIGRSLGSGSFMDTNISLSNSVPDKDKIFGSHHVGNGGDKNATTEEDKANSDDKMSSMIKKDRRLFFRRDGSNTTISSMSVSLGSLLSSDNDASCRNLFGSVMNSIKPTFYE